MSDRNVVIEVNGKQYSGFTGMNATASLRELSRSFVLDAVSDSKQHVPFKRDDKCKIYIGEEKFLTGFVEEITTSGTKSSHKIAIVGRDKLADLVDSRINVLGDLRPPVSLQRCIEHVINHLGLDVKVIDDVGGEYVRFYGLENWATGFSGKVARELQLFTEAEDLATPEPGGKALDYVMGLALKRHSLLVPTANGDLMVTRASGKEIDAAITHIDGDDNNNVLTYTFKDSGLKRFGKYIDISQFNIIAANESGSVTAGKIVDNRGIATDEQVRQTRQLVFESEVASSEGEAQDRSAWELAIRRARGRFYQCNVDGYKNQTGKNWAVGTILPVVDEFVVKGGLKEEMILDKVIFSLDKDSGHSSNLRFVNRDVYQLEAIGNV
ncbi:hypothetical protein LCGC14_1165600 [marine sediment metagenome]|uniref:Prophage tail endopeptidase domain-containing protein n=1 Tax=marine sediment metagenome TaxID=412755 RepID=A0A0F9PWW4_9ZZZZ